MGKRLGGRVKGEPPQDLGDKAPKSAAMKPGLHRVAAGLYLRVWPSGGAFWCLRYKPRAGGATEMGLGALDSLSLAEAKVKAASLRLELKKHGIEPLQAKKKREVELLSAPSRGI